jgi:hypothetical protein
MLQPFLAFFGRFIFRRLRPWSEHIRRRFDLEERADCVLFPERDVDGRIDGTPSTRTALRTPAAHSSRDLILAAASFPSSMPTGRPGVPTNYAPQLSCACT